MYKYIVLIFSLTISTLAFSTDVFEQLFPYDYGEFDGEFDDKWQEDKLSLPNFPESGNLIEFSGPANYSQYQYSLDGETLKVGKDGIVRYVAVISSSAGSKNIYYQGISCKKKMMKKYAYGDSSHSKFIVNQNPQWEMLRRTGAMGYTDNLFSFYFCNRMGAVLSQDEIINRLKYGQGEYDSEYY